MTGAHRFGYRHLLTGVILLYVIILLAPDESVGAPLRVAVSGVLLIMAVRTRRRAGQWGALSIAIPTILVVATFVALATGSKTALECTSQAATVILVVITGVIIASTLVAHGVIDGPAVRGVLSIYLLLGLFFSSVNNFFIPLIPNYLNGAGAHPSPKDTLYFSIITLTTVGYGDIAPVASLARAVSAVEALTGQLYLVSIVAAVVARFEPKRKREASASAATDDAGTKRRPTDAESGANGGPSAAGDEGDGNTG
jgi:hypothetical protein